jgi:2-polyprenyl-3-methyl-5-hydroxy-6-metoxy-1,4-benzoquinol methylase
VEKYKVTNIVKEISSIFPFDNYLFENKIIRPKYFYISRLIYDNFSTDQKILDFGSGLNDVSAVLKKQGFSIDAYDDCNDEWYRENNNLEKLISFSKEINLNFYKNFEDLKNSGNKYKIILLLDVLEHVPNPKSFLKSLFNFLDKNSSLIITVPNSVSLRKRISVIMGKTNYASYEEFFNEEPFRGHWREYSIEDVSSLSKKINFEINHLEGINAIIPKNKFLFFLYKKFNFAYNLLIKLFPSLADTLCVILKKK